MKMETPKMDVVRFKEADVIVASPAPLSEYVSLVSLGNNDFYDNKVVSQNSSGFDLSFDEMKNGALAHLLDLRAEFNNGSSQKSLRSLVNGTAESDEEAYATFNGDYEWDSTASIYRIKQ